MLKEGDSQCANRGVTRVIFKDKVGRCSAGDPSPKRWGCSGPSGSLQHWVEAWGKPQKHSARSPEDFKLRFPGAEIEVLGCGAFWVVLSHKLNELRNDIKITVWSLSVQQPAWMGCSWVTYNSTWLGFFILLGWVKFGLNEEPGKWILEGSGRRYHRF